MEKNKYQNGKIYKIVDNGYNEIYIGSTIRKLSCRMAEHRRDYRDNRNCSSYYLFEKYGLENCKIELIENFPCNNKEELNKREGEHIKNNTNCINKKIAGRTPNESLKNYRNNNKEKIKENRKIYYQNKKNII